MIKGSVSMTVTGVPALSDNYIWVYEVDNKAIIVDPGEFEPIDDYLKSNELELAAILLTHNHEDHTDGVSQLVNQFEDVPIYGPKETASFNTIMVEDGDDFELLGMTFNVFLTAGHTPGHISYLVKNHLFCGDALFSAGCGRVFTKDYEAQYNALKKFNQLPNNVKIYAGHEYTETNLTFAHDIEPDNKLIKEALDKVSAMRERNEKTLPSTIEKEKDINLFMQAGSLEEFKSLRLKRDDM